MISGTDSLDSPGARLKWARLRAGYKDAADFARVTGIKEVTYRAYENDQNGYARKAPDFGRKLNVSSDWLLAGGVPPDATAMVMWVPIIGMAAAGTWKDAVELPSYIVPVERQDGVHMTFGVEISGDSMDRVMAPGSWAILDTEQTRLYDGRVYLIVNDEYEATIKRYRSNPARFEPDSHNPEHQPIYMDECRIQIIGRVIAYGGNKGL